MEFKVGDTVKFSEKMTEAYRCTTVPFDDIERKIITTKEEYGEKWYELNGFPNDWFHGWELQLVDFTIDDLQFAYCKRW